MREDLLWIRFNLVIKMDFEQTNAKLVSHEFLAVVLAGFGNEYVGAIYFTGSLFDHHFPDLFH
jgi:hypothetical protein